MNTSGGMRRLAVALSRAVVFLVFAVTVRPLAVWKRIMELEAIVA